MVDSLVKTRQETGRLNAFYRFFLPSDTEYRCLVFLCTVVESQDLSITSSSSDIMLDKDENSLRTIGNVTSNRIVNICNVKLRICLGKSFVGLIILIL